MSVWITGKFVRVCANSVQNTIRTTVFKPNVIINFITFFMCFFLNKFSVSWFCHPILDQWTCMNPGSLFLIKVIIFFFVLTILCSLLPCSYHPLFPSSVFLSSFVPFIRVLILLCSYHPLFVSSFVLIILCSYHPLFLSSFVLIILCLYHCTSVAEPVLFWLAPAPEPRFLKKLARGGLLYLLREKWLSLGLK